LAEGGERGEGEGKSKNTIKERERQRARLKKEGGRNLALSNYSL